MDWDEEGSTDEVSEPRRRNSLGLALDLRDLKKSLVLSCIRPFDPALLSSQSRPYPSPVSPATTLFHRHTATTSPAPSSAASEAESYFDVQRNRQFSTATSAYTSNYDGDDEDCKEDAVDATGRDLPPSPDLIPISLPSSSSAIPDLPVAEAVTPLPAPTAPSHPLHRAHRLSMTPVATLDSLDLPAISEVSPTLPTAPEPPRVRKSSIVDLPLVSAVASPVPAFATGASELGLEPLLPTPPRSPGARLRMMPIVPTATTSTSSLETVRSARSLSAATTRPWAPSEAIPQLFKVRSRATHTRLVVQDADRFSSLYAASASSLIRSLPVLLLLL